MPVSQFQGENIMVVHSRRLGLWFASRTQFQNMSFAQSSTAVSNGTKYRCGCLLYLGFFCKHTWTIIATCCQIPKDYNLSSPIDQQANYDHKDHDGLIHQDFFILTLPSIHIVLSCNINPLSAPFLLKGSMARPHRALLVCYLEGILFEPRHRPPIPIG